MPAFDPTAFVQTMGSNAQAGRRIGLVLIEDENAEGAATAALYTLAALAASGRRIEGLPTDARTLLRRLWRGTDEAAAERETLSLPDYVRWMAGLPADYARMVAEGWKRPEDDSLFHPGTLDCGHFLIPAVRCGEAAIVAWSMCAISPAASTPPHGHLAAVAWLRDVFGARTVLTVDGRGELAIAPSPF
ncbi:MAG: cobaltochelatase subunit CobN [Alphaproteobacteria bacterium]